jgi:hypothetical protein
MTLQWIQYQVGTKSQYYLILMLLERDDRHIGLLCQDIPTDDIERIRKALSTLSKLSTGEKIQWFRENIKSYNKTYREFKKDRLKVDKTFDLKLL